jgi:rSAM/selenodomain-associated transferase 2
MKVARPKTKISIIIPALNEVENISGLLHSLQNYREKGHELIVVDGGSEDETVAIASPLADKTIQAVAGRSSQMNAGAYAASGDILWFLHADCRVPENSDALIINALTKGVSSWGRFDVRLSGNKLSLRMVEKMMNLRSRLTGIATGDQAIFINRPLFEKVGGFPDQLLMEDVEISKKLKAYQSPVSLRDKLMTSSRRWEQNGVAKTIFLMWLLRAAYFFGVPADKLALHYG